MVRWYRWVRLRHLNAAGSIANISPARSSSASTAAVLHARPVNLPLSLDAIVPASWPSLCNCRISGNTAAAAAAVLCSCSAPESSRCSLISFVTALDRPRLTVGARNLTLVQFFSESLDARTPPACKFQMIGRTCSANARPANFDAAALALLGEKAIDRTDM